MNWKSEKNNRIIDNVLSVFNCEEGAVKNNSYQYSYTLYKLSLNERFQNKLITDLLDEIFGFSFYGLGNNKELFIDIFLNFVILSLKTGNFHIIEAIKKKCSESLFLYGNDVIQNSLIVFISFYCQYLIQISSVFSEANKNELNRILKNNGLVGNTIVGPWSAFFKSSFFKADFKKVFNWFKIHENQLQITTFGCSYTVDVDENSFFKWYFLYYLEFIDNTRYEQLDSFIDSMDIEHKEFYIHEIFKSLFDDELNINITDRISHILDFYSEKTHLTIFSIYEKNDRKFFAKANNYKKTEFQESCGNPDLNKIFDLAVEKTKKEITEDSLHDNNLEGTEKKFDFSFTIDTAYFSEVFSSSLSSHFFSYFRKNVMSNLSITILVNENPLEYETNESIVANDLKYYIGIKDFKDKLEKLSKENTVMSKFLPMLSIVNGKLPQVKILDISYCIKDIENSDVVRFANESRTNSGFIRYHDVFYNEEEFKKIIKEKEKIVQVSFSYILNCDSCEIYDLSKSLE